MTSQQLRCRLVFRSIIRVVTIVCTVCLPGDMLQSSVGPSPQWHLPTMINMALGSQQFTSQPLPAPLARTHSYLSSHSQSTPTSPNPLTCGHEPDSGEEYDHFPFSPSPTLLLETPYHSSSSLSLDSSSTTPTASRPVSHSYSSNGRCIDLNCSPTRRKPSRFLKRCFRLAFAIAWGHYNITNHSLVQSVHELMFPFVCSTASTWTSQASRIVICWTRVAALHLV